MADIEVRPFAPLYVQRQILAPGPGTPGVQTQQGACIPGILVAAVSNAAVASTVFPGNIALNAQNQIYVANKLTIWAHVNFGVLSDTSTVRAATRNDPGIPPNTVAVFTVGPEVNAASVYADGTVGAAPAEVVGFHRGVGS